MAPPLPRRPDAGEWQRRFVDIALGIGWDTGVHVRPGVVRRPTSASGVKSGFAGGFEEAAKARIHELLGTDGEDGEDYGGSGSVPDDTSTGRQRGGSYGRGQTRTASASSRCPRLAQQRRVQVTKQSQAYGQQRPPSAEDFERQLHKQQQYLLSKLEALKVQRSSTEPHWQAELYSTPRNGGSNIVTRSANSVAAQQLEEAANACDVITIVSSANDEVCALGPASTAVPFSTSEVGVRGASMDCRPASILSSAEKKIQKQQAHQLKQQEQLLQTQRRQSLSSCVSTCSTLSPAQRQSSSDIPLPSERSLKVGMVAPSSASQLESPTARGRYSQRANEAASSSCGHISREESVEGSDFEGFQQFAYLQAAGKQPCCRETEYEVPAYGRFFEESAPRRVVEELAPRGDFEEDTPQAHHAEAWPEVKADVVEQKQSFEPRQRQKLQRRRRRKHAVVINLSCCKYESVAEAAEELNWRVALEDEGEWNVFWTDTSVTSQFVSNLQPYQRVNHFPGMFQISRKCDMASALSRMAERLPGAFRFFPETYILPRMAFALEQAMRPKVTPSNSSAECKRTRRTFIVKPTAAAQGKGIYLTRSFARVNVNEPSVCQKYITRPHLIDGYKYDLRVYVLVVSVSPLRVLLYDEGLVRICTEPYCAPTPQNMRRQCMHLTNYAINKHSEDFVPCTDETGGSCGASKRSTAWLLDHLKSKGHDAEALWDEIGEICVKTLISITPSLAHMHNMCLKGAVEPGISKCFELLGIDIMIDNRLRPWLVEVNHSPSFTCDSPLDERIKLSLISDTLRLLNLSPFDSRRHKQASAAASKMRLYEGSGMTQLPPQATCAFDDVSLGGYSIVYPCEARPERQKAYEKMLEVAKELYHHIPACSAGRARPASATAPSSQSTQRRPARNNLTLAGACPTVSDRTTVGITHSGCANVAAATYADAASLTSNTSTTCDDAEKDSNYEDDDDDDYGEDDDEDIDCSNEDACEGEWEE